MPADNKALFHKFVEGMNSHDPNFVDELLDPNYIEHDPDPGVEPDIEGIKEMTAMFFPLSPTSKSPSTSWLRKGTSWPVT